MSTQPSHDAQRPAPRPVPASRSRPHSRSSSQAFSTPRNLSQASVNDGGVSNSQSLGGFEPPLKRQKLDSTRSTSADTTRDEGESMADVKRENKAAVASNAMVSSPVAIKLPPFPTRPGRPPQKSRSADAKPDPPATKREEVSTKPYSIEPPKTAPQYFGGATADYGPWRGKSQEDVLNEQNIKNGFQDKSQVSQNETGSARPMIWASVKHKSGLSILSTLFAATLEQRQAAGAIVAKSTFKPPPRVTLTDAKREAWLRDLADASIPLRRLSRSIPHGIRGKPLLDHCLSKHIPTWRAVWLAKCVGANEIRASKRKGTTGAFATGGESKWIREWTTNVQQFIEGLVDACGTEDWKEKITYGLQLVAHIYSDQLLDRDCFLDWVMATIQTVSETQLPIWLLVARLFWKDMVRYRKRGRLLAIALSEQLVKMHEAGVVDANASLWQKLSGLVKSFMASSPSCFLLPNAWSKYQPVLRMCNDQEDPSFAARFQRLENRNEKIARSATSIAAEYTLTPRQRLIQILDGSRHGYDFSELNQACLDAIEDPALAIRSVLQWAATPFRAGQYRIYLAVRLLRAWSRADIDLDRPIMGLLATWSSIRELHQPSVHKLLAELVRSRHFSLGRYLQWMMARGSASSTAEEKSIRAFEIDLLHSIPLHGLPEHVLNLRQIVLSAMEEPAKNISQDLEVAKSFCASKIPFLKTVFASTTPLSERPIANYDISLKLDLSRWLRQQLTIFISNKEDEMELDEDSDDPAKRVFLSSQDFQAICEVLTDLGDFPILADIHAIFIENCDASLLSEVAESINAHFDCLYAIGAATDLFGKLLERLEDVTSRTAVERQLFAALLELAQRFPNLQKTIARLRQEVAACEPTSAVAMSSPVSDQMAEALQNADSSFFEDIESLFNSGTSMDQPVLLRVFGDIAKRLEAVWSDLALSLTYIELLAKLRTFSPAEFDSRMNQWLAASLTHSKRPVLSMMMIPMVCGGVVTLQGIFKAAESLVANSSINPLAIEVLGLITYETPPKLLTSCPRAYRFERSREELLLDSPSLVGSIVKSAIACCSCGIQDTEAQATQLVSSHSFIRLILECFASRTASDTDALKDAFSAAGPVGPATMAVDSALGLSPLQSEPTEYVKALLKAANDFNVRFCQLRLSSLVMNPAIQESNSDLANALVDEMMSTVAHSDNAWQALVADLPPNLRLRCLEYSTTSLIKSITKQSEEATGDADVASEKDIQSFFTIVETLERHVSLENCSNVLDSMTEVFGRLQAQLDNTSVLKDPSVSMLELRQKQLRRISVSLHTLLDLLVIYQHLLSLSKLAPATLTRLVVSLSLILTSSHIDPTLSSYAADVLAMVSDSLPSETRLHCIQLLRQEHHVQDTRLEFILGYTDSDPDARLALAVPASSGSGTAKDASSGTQGGGAKGDIGEAVRLLPFALRRWELVQDATPLVGENDASLSLTLFGARKAVL